MSIPMRSLPAICLAVIVELGCFASAAFPEDRLQVYGLTLDDTRLGDGFCEAKDATGFTPYRCLHSKQSLPRITNMDVQTTPTPYVILSLEPDADGRNRDVRIWYSRRELGGQSYMITTAKHSPLGLAGARDGVLSAFGAPTVEFSHADMEARGIYVADLTIDTLIYVDRDLPAAQWNQMAYRLRTDFNPTGPELFSLTNSTLRTLGRLLGRDFRGAIVQIAESSFGHQSTVTTMLLDLRRAQSTFQVGG
ncbi:MAG TPA: hypothetical protein VGF43_02980 [Dongiaceae bacterium]